jgi:hypothetical protein
MNTVFSDAVVVTLARQSFDYKLPDSETDDIGEKMNIEVAKLNAQMVTLRVETAAQGEQLRAQLNAQMVTLRVETAAQLRSTHLHSSSNE